MLESAGCVEAQSLDHQTAIEWRIEHALYTEQMGKTLKHILSHMTNCLLEQCTRRIKLDIKQWLEDKSTRSEHIHVKRSMVPIELTASPWKDDVSGLERNDSTMSGGACTQVEPLKNIHSTMSGGGCLFMDHGLESPKHRVSLGLHMKFYVHRQQYSQSQ